MTRHRPNYWEAACVVALCFGWFIVASINAVFTGFPAHAFTDAGMFDLAAFEVAMGATAIMLLWLRGYPVRSLMPRVTQTGTLVGMVLCIFALIAGWLAMALFPSGHLAPLDEIMQGTSVTLVPVLVMAVVNGIYEEVFLLAYLQREFMGHGAAFAIGVSLLVRVLYHLYQGHAGAMGVLVVGLVFGIYYLRTGDHWPPAYAHIGLDVLAFA